MKSDAIPLPRANSLRRRLLLMLLGYAIALSAVVIAQGFFVHERAERLVWEAMLTSELDDAVERMRREPAYQWTDTRKMVLYDARRAPLPPALRGLATGLNDDVVIDDQTRVALMRRVDGRELVLTLDITDFEQRELYTALEVAASTFALMAVLGLLIAWATSRLVRPLGRMADDIGALRPDHNGQRVPLPADATSELQVIAHALNDYLQRNDRFVERERAFLSTASHELRTPLAVITGASELALQGGEDMPAGTRHQLARIRRTAGEVEELIALLLVLAKDPARLTQASEAIALDELLPRIVDDHLHLTAGKALAVSVAPLPESHIHAPMPIVQAAVGNLLRNAIENSDRGTIVVRLETPATVVIEDPGHGMSPEEISAIYARMARGGGDGHDGIGLDLIARLCEHLGWTLKLESQPERGTTTTLAFSA
jgi:signal transduction histidine kinase